MRANTRHAGQTRVTITSTHASASKVMSAYRRVAAIFKTLRPTAERLTAIERRCRILTVALVTHLRGWQLPPC